MPSFTLTAEALIRDGFLFKEATSLFTTSDFADWWSRKVRSFDRNGYPLQSRAAIHSFPKDTRSRRILSFPSPGNYVRLAAAIEENWPSIRAFTTTSKFSLSTLGKPADGRSVSFFRDPKELSKARIHKRVGRRYFLHVDIARFFPSVYLHRFEAIYPGSTVGSRNDGLGSKLDNLCRQLQGRESVGLPLGPDTSFVLAESIGVYIDGFLRSLPISAVRHVDDISIYADSTLVLEKCLLHLRQACDSLRLELNNLKTKMGEVPDDLEADWVAHIRTLAASLKSNDGLVTLCDRVFSYHRSTQDSRLINYALSAMSGFGVRSDDSWKIFQAFLLTSLQVDSRSVTRVGRTLLRAQQAGRTLNRRQIAAIYNDFIIRHAQMNHGYEVSQAVWSLYNLNSLDRLSGRALANAAKMRDNFVAVTLLWLRKQGLVTKFDTGLWREMSTNIEGFSDGDWLLCHEARVQGFFRNLPPTPDVFWQSVRADNISFVDPLGGWLDALNEDETHGDLLHEDHDLALSEGSEVDSY